MSRSGSIKIVSWLAGRREIAVCQPSDIRTRLTFSPENVVLVDSQLAQDQDEAERLICEALQRGQEEVEIYVIEHGMFAGG